tara:strand:- start:109 stop:474 length:366 start_codon:yes stop_codon:yes gene_type:complete
MEKVEMEKFKTLLLEHKARIQNGAILTSKDDLHISSDDLADESDIASNVINQHVSMNMRHRELNKLRLINEALYRIDNGGYGCCDECEEQIGMKRLENQPWATLCITHAEEFERLQGQKAG